MFYTVPGINFDILSLSTEVLSRVPYLAESIVLPLRHIYATVYDTVVLPDSPPVSTGPRAVRMIGKHLFRVAICSRSSARVKLISNGSSFLHVSDFFLSTSYFT